MYKNQKSNRKKEKQFAELVSLVNKNLFKVGEKKRNTAYKWNWYERPQWKYANETLTRIHVSCIQPVHRFKLCMITMILSEKDKAMFVVLFHVKQ